MPNKIEKAINDTGLKHLNDLIVKKYFNINSLAEDEDVAVSYNKEEISFENYMQTNYADTYKTITELPSNTINEIFTHKIINYKNAFNGCAALSILPEETIINKDYSGKEISSIRINYTIPTKDATDISYMFKDCTSLPEVFPFEINCRSITSKEGIHGIFEGASVKAIRFTDVPLWLAQHMTASWIGSKLEYIGINNIYGKILPNEVNA